MIEPRPRTFFAVVFFVAVIALALQIYRLKNPGVIELPPVPQVSVSTTTAAAATPSRTPQAFVAPKPGPAPTPVPTPANPRTEVVPAPSDRGGVAQTIQTCFAQTPQAAELGGVRDVPTLLQHLEKKGVLHDGVEVENYQIVRPDGTQQRLQLLYRQEADRPERVEMQLFNVDVAGNSVAAEMPGSDSVNPTDDMVENYLGQGDVEDHDIQRKLLLNDGTEADVEIRNGRARKLSVRTGDRRLECGALDCQCLQ